MDTQKCARIIAVVCSIGVLCALVSGLLGSLILLLIALPLAIYCRWRMSREKEEIACFLQEHNARKCMKGDCFEGRGELRKNEECLILFKEDCLEITYGEKKQSSLIVPMEYVESIHVYTVEQAMDLARVSRTAVLGKLGEAMSAVWMSPKKKEIKAEKEVRYLVVNGFWEHKTKFTLSFYAGKEYHRYNMLAAGEEDRTKKAHREPEQLRKKEASLG